MTNSLAGRVAVVTASSRGMGRGIAEHFLAEGASVVISGRTEETGAKALAELGAGERAVAFACDARDQTQVEALIDNAAAHFGRLDILVNCAGGSDGFALIHEMTDAAWGNAMDFVLNSAFWGTRLALPHMLSNGFGRIINISSIEGKQGNKANVAHYITAKHGLNGLTKATAFEYGGRGITCNAICPGTVESPSLDDRLRAQGDYDQTRSAFIARQPIGRIGRPEEIADLVLYLATATYTTGQAHIIDGGWAL